MSAAPGSILSQDKEQQQLHQDWMNKRERYRKLEADWLRRVDEAKEQNHKDLQTMEEKHRSAELVLIEMKDKIRDSVQESVENERRRMAEIHQADLEQKQRQHDRNLQEQKKLLEQDVGLLEEQLSQ